MRFVSCGPQWRIKLHQGMSPAPLHHKANLFARWYIDARSDGTDNRSQLSMHSAALFKSMQAMGECDVRGIKPKTPFELNM